MSVQRATNSHRAPQQAGSHCPPLASKVLMSENVPLRLSMPLGLCMVVADPTHFAQGLYEGGVATRVNMHVVLRPCFPDCLDLFEEVRASEGDGEQRPCARQCRGAGDCGGTPRNGLVPQQARGAPEQVRSRGRSCRGGGRGGQAPLRPVVRIRPHELLLLLLIVRLDEGTDPENVAACAADPTPRQLWPGRELLVRKAGPCSLKGCKIDPALAPHGLAEEEGRRVVGRLPLRQVQVQEDPLPETWARDDAREVAPAEEELVCTPRHPEEVCLPKGMLPGAVLRTEDRHDARHE
mmetsp:Transcript_70020/g.198450  ORF Transcript_70020/g.198450 Transcript_70020/m.198450 type:complete len:294 (-) Transcript_70020:1141-2022(-)